MLASRCSDDPGNLLMRSCSVRDLKLQLARLPTQAQRARRPRPSSRRRVLFCNLVRNAKLRNPSLWYVLPSHLNLSSSSPPFLSLLTPSHLSRRLRSYLLLRPSLLDSLPLLLLHPLSPLSSSTSLPSPSTLVLPLVTLHLVVVTHNSCDPSLCFLLALEAYYHVQF